MNFLNHSTSRALEDPQFVLSITDTGKERSCMPGYARCADNRCVMRACLCDGVAQCRDGSDESNCKCMYFLASLHTLAHQSGADELFSWLQIIC